MQVFHDHEKRMPEAYRSNERRHRLALAFIARGVAHGVIERAQLQRLRQFQEIVQVNGAIVIQQPASINALCSLPSLRFVTCWLEREQAPYQRVDGPLPLPDAEIQDKDSMAIEASVSRNPHKLLGEARFANAGLAANLDRLAFAGFQTSSQHTNKSINLVLPSDQCSAARSAPLGPQRPHEVGRDGNGESFDGQRTTMIAIGCPTYCVPDILGNQGLARASGIRKPGRQVHRLPCHRIVRVASNIARHDLAARDANMHMEPPPGLRTDLGHSLVDRLGGVDRAYGIVTVRYGRTEDGHDAVADMLVDRAAVIPNDGIGPVDELTENSEQFLRIEFGGELRVAGYIGEQHGNVPAFCGERRLAAGTVPAARRQSIRQLAEGLDRCLKPPAVAEVQAQLLEVGFRQTRKDIEPDSSFGQCLRQMAEASSFEPWPDVIHHWRPRSTPPRKTLGKGNRPVHSATPRARPQGSGARRSVPPLSRPARRAPAGPAARRSPRRRDR